jgi:hypothetical protein
MNDDIIPKAGDRIVVDLGDERCNVDKIAASGERVTARTNIPIKDGFEIARVGAHEDGGRILHAHHSAPESIRAWNP